MDNLLCQGMGRDRVAHYARAARASRLSAIIRKSPCALRVNKK